MNSPDPKLEILPAADAQVAVVPEVLQLETVVKQSGLAPMTADSLLTAYRPIFAAVHDLLTQAAASPPITDPSQLDEIERADTLRKALMRERTKGDKLRETLKASAMREANAVQGIFNVLKLMVEPVEERLKEGVKIAERIQAERKAKLKADRETALRPFVDNAALFNLAEMTPEVFDKLLADFKAAKIAADAAKAKAEADRLEAIAKEAARIEAQRIENERLAKLAAEQESALKAEREAAAKAQAEADAKLAELRDAEAKRITDAAKAEKDRLAAEAEAARKAAAAPDAEKLLFLVLSVRSLLGVNPKMATEAGQQAFKDARFYLEDAAEKIEHLAAKL